MSAIGLPTALLARLGGQLAAVDMIDAVDHALRSSPTELAALTLALEHTRAACVDDARFTQDRVDAEEHAEMTSLCATCPLRRACGDYAAAAQPPTGFWAGNPYPITTIERRTA